MPLLHQITLGSRTPPLNRECLDSWLALERSGFEIIRWDDSRALDFVSQSHVSGLRPLYARARNLGEASDILRMAVAYSYGGLYVDWDVLLLDPDRFLAVMPDLDQSACVLLDDPRSTDPTSSRAFDNSLFFLRQHHPLALDFLVAIDHHYRESPVPDTPFLTGPLALTRFLESRPDYLRECRTVDVLDIYALDYEDVIRETDDRPERRHLLKAHQTRTTAPAIHFWSHTWAPRPSWSNRLRARASRLLRRPRHAR